MEVIKRKISLEDSTDRSYNSPNWGTVTADTFYLNIIITQNMDDIGLFTDMPFIMVDGTNPTNNPSVFYNDLYNRMNNLGILFPFMTGATSKSLTGYTETTDNVLRFTGTVESDYYNYGNLRITGNTDSKIEELKSYNAALPYILGFDIASETYFNYQNVSIAGHSRVVSDGNPFIYTFDTLDNIYIGTTGQTTGIQYRDYLTGGTRVVMIDGTIKKIPITTIAYIGEGWNETNTSLSAVTKEEYLFGIISPPEVQSDVFIDRGITSVMDRHLRLSEINTLEGLTKYGNGFYKITRE